MLLRAGLGPQPIFAAQDETRRFPMKHFTWVALAAWATLTAALPVQASDAKTLRTRSLAATCAHCHGTEGQAVEGQAFIRLAGLNKEYMLNQLLAFRGGQRKATVMHQITKGYSPEQLEEIATYFASLK
jgi:cytochrome subunit of sulfide dehydrogenase